MAIELRTITIDNHRYLWKRAHIHPKEYNVSPCTELITVYREGKKKSPLRITFKEDDNYLPERANQTKWFLHDAGSGVIWQADYDKDPQGGILINFNRPQVIKEIILYFLSNGWDPETGMNPLEIKDGLKYLDKLVLTSDPLFRYENPDNQT